MYANIVYRSACINILLSFFCVRVLIWRFVDFYNGAATYVAMLERLEF